MKGLITLGIGQGGEMIHFMRNGLMAGEAVAEDLVWTHTTASEDVWTAATESDDVWTPATGSEDTWTVQ